MLTVYQDTDWWAVWVGRHALENLTSVPNGQLKWFSTPLLTVRGKWEETLVVIKAVLQICGFLEEFCRFVLFECRVYFMFQRTSWARA